MSTTNPAPVRKSFTRTLIIAEQLVIFSAIVAGLGFYAGIQYSHAQAKHDAQIIKAAQASPAPSPDVPKH